jgi:fumarylpyruvate hydrolase
VTSYVIPPSPQASLAVADTSERFPVRRIICVGRNYEAHAREMGKDPTREKPFFFMKPADTVMDTGSVIAYPPLTSNFHHEIELVIAIGVSGANIRESHALQHVFGYAVGIDLTRRDLQFVARDAGRPWEWGKAFDHSAPIAPIHRATHTGHLSKGAIWLTVNGADRQRADIADLIWSVPEIISIASHSVRLEAGDIIMTGTPAGVGPLERGDTVHGGIDGLTGIAITIA